MRGWNELRNIALVSLLALACNEARPSSSVGNGNETGAGGELGVAGADADGPPAETPEPPSWVGDTDAFTPFALGSEGGGGEGGATPQLPLGPPHGTSTTCSDAIVGDDEECDDGAGGADACTADCKTRDQAVGPAYAPPQPNDRYLGVGRHPVSGLDTGFITTFVDAGGDEPAIESGPHSGQRWRLSLLA